MFLRKVNAFIWHFMVFSFPIYILLFLNNEINERIAPQLTRTNQEVAGISLALGIFVAIIFRLPVRVTQR